MAFIKNAFKFLGESYQTFWVFLSRCFVCDFPPGTLGRGIGIFFGHSETPPVGSATLCFWGSEGCSGYAHPRSFQYSRFLTPNKDSGRVTI